MSPVNVGIVGLSAGGGFAAGAHVPAIRALDGFALRACTASTPASSRAAAEAHDVPLAFDSAAELAASDEVDLVVVTVKVPHHRELVLTALEAGKPVLCEWPLGNGAAESAELADEAAARGLLGVVGLQARAAPAVRYLRDLVADGYVGEPLSTTLVGSGVTYGATVPPGARYGLDPRNGATMVTIPVGHALDALALVLGEVAEARSTLAIRRPQVRLQGSGEPLTMEVPDQVAVTGTLGSGAVLALHYRGGLSRGTNLHWEINGTEGDLVVTGSTGHLQLSDLEIRGGRGDDSRLTVLPVPTTYHRVPGLEGAGARIDNVAHAYAHLLEDLTERTAGAPTFRHAARHHALLERIVAQR